MRHRRATRRTRGGGVPLVLVLSLAGRTVGAEAMAFHRGDGQLRIAIGETNVATYSFRDPKIPRPYFAHVRAADGVQVTRNHPPVPGVDATDHAELHPGVWLAFSYLSGADNWRLKTPVVHDGFIDEPKGTGNRGGFAVRNLYLDPAGQGLAKEVCRYDLFVRRAGWLLVSRSVFEPLRGELVFGDEEEMGLGIRVATPIAPKSGKGGRMLDADGRRNEKAIRGRTSAWCDYSGPVGGRWAGILVMPDPRNPHPCRYHARDYGFLAANPFARAAFGQGPPRSTRVPKGDRLRLGFGLLVHSSDSEQAMDLDAAYRDFTSVLGELPPFDLGAD